MLSHILIFENWQSLHRKYHISQSYFSLTRASILPTTEYPAMQTHRTISLNLVHTFPRGRYYYSHFVPEEGKHGEVRTLPKAIPWVHGPVFYDWPSALNFEM